MAKSKYLDFAKGKLTLRDYLAAERTALANERTLLSYVRTMIGIIAIGGTVIKFFHEWYMVTVGIILVLSGFVILVVGFTRYLKTYFVISEIENHDGRQNLQNDKIHHFLYTFLKKLHLISALAN